MRKEQIASLMEQLRPKVEEALRKLVERAVDVPEAEESGAIEYEFRDAGLDLANEVRHPTKRRSATRISWHGTGKIMQLSSIDIDRSAPRSKNREHLMYKFSSTFLFHGRHRRD